MCGIMFSFNIEKNKSLKILKQLSLRGRDGWGIYESNFNNRNITKKSLENINDELPVLNYDSKIILANSRAVPTTEYEAGAGFDIKNQQPFENKRFVVVHNGNLSNDNILRKKYDIKTESKVDTSILPELFEKVGVIKGLKMLRGNYSILCWDKEEKKLYVAKNFMPLRMVICKNKLIFVSIPEMLDEEDVIISKEVETYTCYEFKIDNFQYTYKKHNLLDKEKNKRVLIIISGGIDSTTVAYLYKYLGYEIGLIHFLYGQAASEVERFAVEYHAKKLNAELIIYDAKKLFKPFKDVSELLHKNKPDEGMQMVDAEETKSYVPNRNAILSMITAGYAEMLGYDTIALGAQGQDSAYPDNTNCFIDNINQTLKYSLNWFTNVKYTAPLINLYKHEVVALGQKLGLDYSMTVPCYYPKLIDSKIVRCYQCGCCQYADASFKMVEERTIIKNKNNFINKYIKNYI